MIPDVQLQRSLHLIQLGLGLYICQASGLLVYYQEAFVILVVLTFLKTKLTFAQERSPSCVQQGFYPHRHQGVLENDILHTSTSGWSARRSTTWIIRTSVGRSTILRTYVCQRKRHTTNQWRRRFNEKADCIDWFKKLIWKVDLKSWSESRKVD